MAATGSTIISSFVPGGSFFIKPTIVRTRGEVSIKPDAFNADIDINGAFGMCVVSQDALTAGIASIPKPFSDAEWGGWFVWQSFAKHLEQVTNAGLLLGSWDYQVDSKAMRKITTNDVIVSVAESISGAAFDIAMHLRVLLKLS